MYRSCYNFNKDCHKNKKKSLNIVENVICIKAYLYITKQNQKLFKRYIISLMQKWLYPLSYKKKKKNLHG